MDPTYNLGVFKFGSGVCVCVGDGSHSETFDAIRTRCVLEAIVGLVAYHKR